MQTSPMITILEISESKGAEFSVYEFYFKKNIHRSFLYMSKCLFSTLTADYEYSRGSRENLPLPIHMQFSKKPKIFCSTFIAFLESKLNFEQFKTKNEPHRLIYLFLKLVTPKVVVT